MQLIIRRQSTIIEDVNEEAGIVAAEPLRRVAVVSVVVNPFAGKSEYQPDLSAMIASSVPLGKTIAERARQVLGDQRIQSYGKGGIVGLAGEQEHANALLTTEFANPIRHSIGCGKAWISSVTKRAAPGTLIDIPMNHTEDVYVRSHYGTMSIVLPDAPLPDEIAIIFCLASGGRLNARVGGLSHEEVMARTA